MVVVVVVAVEVVLGSSSSSSSSYNCTPFLHSLLTKGKWWDSNESTLSVPYWV